MISRYSYHGLTWIDLESPTREEILHIGEEYSLPKTTQEGLFSPTTASNILASDASIYLVLHFPIEVDFVIGKNSIITVHYEKCEAIQDCATMFEHAEKVDQQKSIANSGLLFLEIIKHLYSVSLKQLHDSAHRTGQIEHALYKNKEQDVLTMISNAMHPLLDLKQAIAFHIAVVDSYKITSARLFGESYDYAGALIATETQKIYTLIQIQCDKLTMLQETNTAMIRIAAVKNLRYITSILYGIGFIVLIIICRIIF
jgi:Mg2+ and Co2+ transporter CorA